MKSSPSGVAASAQRAPSPSPAGRRRSVNRVLVPGVAIALGGVLLASGWGALRPTEPVRVAPAVFVHAETGPPPPTTANPSEARPSGGQPAGRAAQAAGWIEPDPYTTACTALADGVVREILVLEGESVEAGQVVARLIDDDARLALARTEAELSLARAEVERARAVLAAAQEDWDNPTERERRVATSLAQLRETEAELAQLPSLIEAERVSRERLDEQLARLLEASASGAVSSIELMIARRRAESQGAAVAALEARQPILAARRDRLVAEVEAATRDAALRTTEREALDGARAGLARAQAAAARSGVARDEAALRLERMTIRAPISGLVQRRLKAPGDKVMLAMDDPHSAHLVHLYDQEKLQVRVDVPLADAAGVVLGQRCEVIVEVLPDQSFAGEISRITHEADLQKNTLQVKVRLLEPAPILKPEMLARVKFLAGEGASEAAPRAPGETHASRVRVPQDAVHSDGAGHVVWAVRGRRRDRGIATPIALKLGARSEGWIEVSGDLHPGDLLVVGEADLAPGRQVRVVGLEGGAG